jgi:hypothetical protein
VPERTSHASVTFSRPFLLEGVDGLQPAGTYRIETVEVALADLSFLAYRRISTTIELPALGIPSLRRQLANIDPGELDAALKADLVRHAAEDTRSDVQQG